MNDRNIVGTLCIIIVLLVFFGAVLIDILIDIRMRCL